jgi:hypothetical protein
MTALALYRPDAEVHAWADIEVVARYPNGDVICRELNRPLPGVFIAKAWQVAYHQTPEPA